MFAQALRELRLSRGMTQQELADKAGVSKSTISMLESGKRKPSYETLELFADIFNVDMNTLTGADTERDPQLKAAAAHFDTDRLTDEGREMLESYYRYLAERFAKD